MALFFQQWGRIYRKITSVLQYYGKPTITIKTTKSPCDFNLVVAFTLHKSCNFIKSSILFPSKIKWFTDKKSTYNNKNTLRKPRAGKLENRVYQFKVTCGKSLVKRGALEGQCNWKTTKIKFLSWKLYGLCTNYNLSFWWAHCNWHKLFI